MILVMTPCGWSVNTVMDSKHKIASFHSVSPHGRVTKRYAETVFPFAGAFQSS